MRMIPVILYNNQCKIVTGNELDHLLSTGRARAFRRSTGWVPVGRNPIRGAGGAYFGPDKRMQWGLPSRVFSTSYSMTDVFKKYISVSHT